MASAQLWGRLRADNFHRVVFRRLLRLEAAHRSGQEGKGDA